MTEILRVKTRWTGFSGAPGYTVMHFRDFSTGGDGPAGATADQAAAAVTRVRTFFDAIKTSLPSAVRLDIEAEVEVIEDSTGALVNSFGVAAPAQIAGTGTGNFSSSTGGVVNWRTNGIRNGRRVRGRTFLVPLAAISMAADGSMNPLVRTALQTAASALADSSGSPDIGVYARPSAKGATDGEWYAVTSAKVSTKLAVLTSRRD